MQGRHTLGHQSLNRPSSSNVRPPLPSPATSSSVSPTKQHSQHTAYPFPRTNTKTSSTSEDHFDGESEDEISGEDRKLEQRREKNRIKQRNLRLRRQKHLSELEEENTVLKGEVSTLHRSLHELQQRENNLHAWIRDLESVLFARGLSGEVNSLRRIWSGSGSGSGSHQHVHPQQPQQSQSRRPSADPLATLASAAMASRPGTTPPPVRPPSSSASSTARASADASGAPYPILAMPWHDHGIKRKREDEFYPPPPPPPHSSHQAHPSAYPHPSHATVAPLAPPPLATTSYPSGSGSSSTSRPSTAPHPSLSPRVSATPRGSMHSGSIRISDLLSPLPSDTISEAVEDQLPVPDHASVPDALSRRESTAIVEKAVGGTDTLREQENARRWSVGGDLWVIDHSLSSSKQNDQLLPQQGQNVSAVNAFPPPHSVASSSSRSNSYFSNAFSQIASGGYGQTTGTSSTGTGYRSGGGSGREMFSQVPLPFITFDDSVSTTTSIFPPTSPISLGLIDPDLSTHPSILAARSFLLSVLPSPLPFPLPALPPLEPAFQRLVLLALTNLVPLHSQHVFHQRQLKFIPAEDAKTLLQYQADPHADPRLILFPIAILRAKAVRHLMDGHGIDVTEFVNHTLCSARIFGATLDPDAWEMDDAYWSVWEKWFPRGTSYCRSLGNWRRRDGHTGSTVLEMLLGVEAPGARRTEPVGKPPNWTF